MKLKVKAIDLEAGRNLVVMNEEDARDLGIHIQDRVKVSKGARTLTAIVSLSESMIRDGEIGLFRETLEELDAKNGDEVSVLPTHRPASVEYIKKKMRGEKLTKDEIYAIIRDITEENLSDVEMAAYVTAIYTMGMDMDETEWATRAMVETGETIDFDTTIFDIHSVGGVPGNKYAPITVSIAAQAGLRIPKTSSRAISSAAGTADVMEVLTNVALSARDIKRIVNEVGATLAWGGSMNLAPADDKIVQVEYPLGIDPHPQVLASVMAKKKAVGTDFLVIDLPMGPETKVPDMKAARRYAMDFIGLGERLGITVECAVTYGEQPIGRAIGPALEAKEALMVLEGRSVSNSIVEKSTDLAGILLEMANVAAKGEGKRMAKEILESGKARDKFLEIINAQGSRGIERSDDVVVGEHTFDYLSPMDGYVGAISNRAMVAIARAAGAPKDKGAGIWLHKKKGDKVEKGEPLFTVHAECEAKLEVARDLLKRLRPYTIVGMLLERIPMI
jgi:AMP phosphorylase